MRNFRQCYDALPSPEMSPSFGFSKPTSECPDYFWVLRHDAKQYKLYIGQTNSLANRLVNYVSDFQPHSPNDYKLRIFAAYLAEIAPTAELDLYFAETDTAKLRSAEKDAIRRYEPLLNKLPPPSPEAREKLRQAFEFYYRFAFQKRLTE